MARRDATENAELNHALNGSSSRDQRADSSRPAETLSFGALEADDRALVAPIATSDSSLAIECHLPDRQGRPRGGPQTLAGKANSRRNALRHGLTAKTLLDEILPAGRVDALRRQLLADLAPRSALERLLVDQIARHGAMLEIGEQAEVAVLRRGAKELVAMRLDEEDGDADERRESLLAAAVASDAVDKFARYRRGHEKGVVSAIKTLMELGRAGRPVGKPHREPAPAAAPRGWTDGECEKWLLQRWTQGLARCPFCGRDTPNWLERRKVLQCKACRRQYGLRSGTVMANSRLPLATWFNAIEQLVADPAIAAAELARRVGLRRNGTAQAVQKKIRAALRAPDAEEQLAGLNRPV